METHNAEKSKLLSTEKCKISSSDYLRQREKANARKKRFLDNLTEEKKEMKKAKDRAYYHRKKADKKVKNIAEMTDRERRRRRIIWKEASQKYRDRKKTFKRTVKRNSQDDDRVDGEMQNSVEPIIINVKSEVTSPVEAQQCTSPSLASSFSDNSVEPMILKVKTEATTSESSQHSTPSSPPPSSLELNSPGLDSNIKVKIEPSDPILTSHLSNNTLQELNWDLPVISIVKTEPNSFELANDPASSLPSA